MNPDRYTVRYMAWSMACSMALNGRLEPPEVLRIAKAWERWLLSALPQAAKGAVVNLHPTEPAA